MENKNKYLDTLSGVDFFKLMKNLGYAIGQPWIEVFFGIWKDIIPYFPCILWGALFDLAVMTRWDQHVFHLLKMDLLYPRGVFFYTLYCICGATFGFWLWGVLQVIGKRTRIERLTEVFIAAGLKSPMGKLPGFIFDKPIDEVTRRLRLASAYLPKSQFDAAKERLETGLQVYIDEIKENRERGTIDIVYSHYEMPREILLDRISNIGRNKFLIGATRAKQITGSLLETPHLLIGGQTGGGKSTFLRQFITTLYVNNSDYRFSLIDLKGGLEFQLFEKQRRIEVISDTKGALELLRSLDKLLTSRMAILKANQCKDIIAYQKMIPEKRIIAANVADDVDASTRHVVVIDEAAELFLAQAFSKPNEVQEAKKIAVRIAAQGRSCGVHLVVATQKPDVKAVDSQIKTNLTGILSFQMPNLASSFTIVGNGRASELPSIPGRAIWKMGLDYSEVQTPFISPEQVKAEFKKFSAPLAEEALDA